MTVNGGQQIIRTVQDFEPTILPTTINWVDDGSKAPRAETPTVSKDVFDKVILDAQIHGPRTVNPLDSSAPDGSSDKGTTPANPDAPYILTAEPEAKSSAIGDHLASFDNKLVTPDASWIGKDDKTSGSGKGKNAGTADAGTPAPESDNIDLHQPGGKCETMAGLIVKCDPAVIARNQGSGTMADQMVPKSGQKYVDQDSNTGGGNHSLPDIDGMLSGGKSAPSGDAMGLGQFKSGSAYDFKSMESGLEKLLGIDTSSKSSSGGTVAPSTGIEALMQKFGMDGFNAHLKDGSFDLDNFSAGAPSTKGPILDLDGNGQQDVIEWALSQLVTEKADVAIVEEFHSNPALTEFHQMMMDKYADVFIA